MKNIDEIICSVFKLTVDQLQDELGMDEIDRWDSLAHMDLITAIESEFDILLSGDDIADMQSVAEIKSIVQKHLSNN